ncbi:uncharacterized protein LOC129762124 [Toxorhynchites rutilus septentrionalis]|uniref:uncharacterized protein LOC129762124 n=1 Tax=Toxorhynchites rutilus septentrionalis TaxID=329112 RepID=UPI0024792CAE|nr:uncharacterized protein LOC129762124 [Toxorhynchites rutilus septentrionalis]
MKRKLNVLELRRLKESSGQQHQIKPDESPTKKRAFGASSKRPKSVCKNLGGYARPEDPRENQNLSAEEIALMFMEVSENINRCFDFDLQKWLSRYEALRGKDVNFPEVAMIIMSAAQIYGRKVDYLEDIVLHMEQDQKGRDESNEKGDKPNVTTGRKRATRFQPQSLSDCFSDLEFTVIDEKTVPVDNLVSRVEGVDVDRRNKFQQMQELCNELRMMPTKQRRQEILNRLRDEANIPPIMSSHTAARKNQILDLESGETIGTRYDYQIHVNFIDVRTGTLVPEHDLKRFFQRCDVIDYLFEQQQCDRLVSERDTCPILPLKPREFKMYLPPDYLKNKYRIQMNDTSDFDNELYQARSSNYQEDPMLKLMGSKHSSRDKDHQRPIEAEKDVDALETSACTEEASFENVSSSSVIERSIDDSMNMSALLDSSQEVMNSSQETSTLDSSQRTHPTELDSENVPSEDTTRCASKEQSPEPELMALENQPEGASSGCGSEPSQSLCQSRLSMEDEGIGADRDSTADATSPLSFARTPSMDKLSDCIESLPKTPEPGGQFFGGGTVIGATVVGGSLRTISLKPALLNLNVLKIPECHLRKHLLFTLPVEYKRRKMDLVRRTSDRNKDMLSLTLFSLHPRTWKSSEWQKRPTTPEPEDFYGFDEYAEILNGPYGKCLYSLAPISEGRCSSFSRASSPESDFFGFDSDTLCQAIPSCGTNQNKIANEDTGTTEDCSGSDNAKSPEQGLEPVPPPLQCEPTSQQSTPTRTLSRDSGISDDQTERRESRSKENTPEPFSAAPEATATALNDKQIMGSNNKTVSPGSAKYIQSVTEAKELIEKVNNWHRKLKPILIQSEKRNHFDIHAYGTEIIDSFGMTTTTEGSLLSAPVISFAQIMGNKQQDYTARYFLSMLMLANTNNVQILARNQDSNQLSETNDIELRLLSRKRHHQEMESMGEKIPCDNTLPGDGGKTKSVRAKKRKRLEEDDVGMERGAPKEMDGVQRLQEDDEPNHDFLDKIGTLYPDINSEETVRKRIAFSRGMRRYAYGFLPDVRSVEVQVAVGEPPPAEPDPHPPPKPAEKDMDEILSVDLLTNEAVLVPINVDPDPCCSKSVYSVAESGYDSMLGVTDC